MPSPATTPANRAKPDPSHYDIVIVGAGVAGASAAYHLQKAVKEGTTILVLDAAPRAGHGIAPRHSGSATMPAAPCVKMMVACYSGSSAEFHHHHGSEGCRRYLQATKEGLVLQKGIAREIWNHDGCSVHLKELGSYYVAYKEDESELLNEFQQLKSFGCDDIEWCDKSRLDQVDGLSSKFHCGIYFPKDAVIDSSLYARALLQYTLDQAKGSCEFWPDSVVSHVAENSANNDPVVTITLQSGQSIVADQVVMATGALFQDPRLYGILKPCYSYLVHVPISTNQRDDGTFVCQDSPNFFTWNFTHDWCFTKGAVRTSGEDHFSAYKDPQSVERCRNLSRWTLEQYDCPRTTNDDDDEEFWQSIPQQYGLYSETPDMAPLIGHLTKQSRICYLLGCNAWGQTILSYCSSLVPGLLGYQDLSESQHDCLKLVSIKRFCNLPAALPS